MAISRIAIKDRKELQKIIADEPDFVEMGLTVICNDMPIDTKTNIDVLCHDDDGQLVILKLSTQENDNMFFEGLKTLTYVNSVKPLLKFSYKDFAINESETPRLVFLAPSYSKQLVDVVGQIQETRMDLYTWEYFEFDDKKALHLEPVWLSEETKSNAKKAKSKKSKKSKKKDAKKPEKDKIEEAEDSPTADSTEEVLIPPEEPELDSTITSDKDKTKKKSIFSI